MSELGKKGHFDPAIEKIYLEMACDAQRELEAGEWCEGLISGNDEFARQF
jgi:hypothetical protein